MGVGADLARAADAGAEDDQTETETGGGKRNPDLRRRVETRAVDEWQRGRGKTTRLRNNRGIPQTFLVFSNDANEMAAVS